MSLLRLAFAVLAALASADFAFAQSAPAPLAVARAQIESVAPHGASLEALTRGGEKKTVRLSDKTIVTLVVPASLADVNLGAFIGVAALPGEGGALKAMEVHVFPAAMRGTGEGHRPFDLAPGSTMTNGTITGRVEAKDGAELTVAYKGGQHTIIHDSNAPVVAFEPGARSDLKVGAAIIARGAPGEDGSIDAARILVGKDGLVPPL